MADLDARLRRDPRLACVYAPAPAAAKPRAS
jgi:hypothetical protein